MKTLWLLPATLLMATIRPGDSSPLDKRHNPKTSPENNNNLSKKSNVKTADEDKPAEPLDACVTRDCIGASFRLLNAMNTSVNPCDDFYEFSCGRYLTETTIPSDKGRWGSFDPVTEEIYARGRALLEQKSGPDDFDSYLLIRKHFKGCMDTDKLEELGVKPVTDRLKEFGGWPVLEGEDWQDGDNFKWWEWIYKMNRAGLGIDSIVTFSLGADDKNTSWRVLGLDQASLGLSREYLIKEFDDKDVQHYYKFMVDTAVLFGAQREQAESELKESLMFEIELAKINAPREDRRNATLLYNPITLGKLPTYDELPPSWTDYFKTIFEDSNIVIDDNEKIIVTNLEFHKKLSELLVKTKKRTLANYLGWQAAKTLLTYINDAARDVKHRFDKAISGIQEASPTWKRCVSEMGFNSFSGGGFGFVAGSMYARKYFKPEAKHAMIEMTQYIRQAFKEDVLENLDWMDEKTKERARNKLEKMDQFIAYSDEFLSKEMVDGLHQTVTIEDDDFLGNTLNLIRFWRRFYYNQLRDKIDTKSWLEHSLVTVVNAFYNPGQNNMEFPAGILQGAFFNAEVPKYLNFGAIGMVIGHEITHGFDDQGKQRNDKGEIENWWEPETEASYKEKAQCIIDQYGNFTATQIGLNLNGINNQGENIADNGGLKEAYKAYLRWVKDNHEEQVLAGLPFTPRQMFWISFGQIWCTKFRDESLKQQILTGYHSPGEFRVIGSLSNNPDFANDFKCQLGTKMNPVKKCAVW